MVQMRVLVRKRRASFLLLPTGAAASVLPPSLMSDSSEPHTLVNSTRSTVTAAADGVEEEGGVGEARFRTGWPGARPNKQTLRKAMGGEGWFRVKAGLGVIMWEGGER